MAMNKSKSLPVPALRIHTYADLEPYAQAFAAGHLNLLILCGPPGVGKSHCLRRAVGEKVCWIDGNASAFGIYQEAYERRNQPLVLDDVDGLYRDRNGIRLLKSLCQTEPVKSLRWHTNAPMLEKRGIPRQFTTTSRVAFITNLWQSLNADVAALEDRGHFLVFEPTTVEVHRQAAQWFWDQEVFDFVGSLLPLMKQPSFRNYILGWELKTAGLDWQTGILGRCLSGAALVAAKLKADPSYESEEARAQAFVRSGAGCRATYFKNVKKLPSGETIPTFVLASPRPSVQAPSPLLAPPLCAASLPDSTLALRQPKQPVNAWQGRIAY
jgi:hypothetical protein